MGDTTVITGLMVNIHGREARVSYTSVPAEVLLTTGGSRSFPPRGRGHCLERGSRDHQCHTDVLVLATCRRYSTVEALITNNSILIQSDQ